MSKTRLNQKLIEALKSLDEKSLENFLNAMLSSQEIGKFNNRFEIAKQLSTARSQRHIAKEMGVSNATVCRVHQSLSENQNTLEKIFINN